MVIEQDVDASLTRHDVALLWTLGLWKSKPVIGLFTS